MLSILMIEYFGIMGLRHNSVIEYSSENSFEITFKRIVLSTFTI